MTKAEEYRRKSQIAGGVCLIALVFLLETYSVDRLLPNPASSLIWAILITVALVAGVLGLWFRGRAGKI
jgi:hypothetical protein